MAAHACWWGATARGAGVPGMSYNHGILLSSAALLHRVTGEAAYLDAASRLLAAAAANLTDVEGSLRDVQRGSRDQGVPCAARLGPIPNPAPIRRDLACTRHHDHGSPLAMGPPFCGAPRP